MAEDSGGLLCEIEEEYGRIAEELGDERKKEDGGRERGDKYDKTREKKSSSLVRTTMWRKV
jgi:hypothetical protein